MPASLSQISRRGTRPKRWISSHIPNSRSSVRRRQHPPGDEPRVRSNHDQHRQQRGRSVLQRDPLRREPQIALRRVTRLPDQPVSRVRRAIVRPQRAHVVPEPCNRPGPADPFGDHRRRHLRVLGHTARTLASNGVNAVGTGARSYLGERSDATARSTVARPTPNCRATCRRGTPCATRRRINAQSSTEITHPICLGGLVFDRRYGLVFKRRRHVLGRSGRKFARPAGPPPG